MKSTIVLFVFAMCCVTMSQAKLQCDEKPADVPQAWRDMRLNCTTATKEQVQMEINASMTYLAMGAHFAKDTVNRPGFSEFFFKAAAEEREHGMKLIEYLLMRGQLAKGEGEISKLITIKNPEKKVWVSAVEALKDALATEAKVTESIRRVITACEDDSGFNDYHFVDYLTGVYLEEQYHGQRELAGKISTLDKMMRSQGAIGEFLYDKKM